MKIKDNVKIQELAERKIKELKKASEYYKQQAEEFRSAWRLDQSSWCLSEADYARRAIEIIEEIFYEKVEE